ncbi:MAG TPA: hypothetical protein VK436_10810 [Methanocella sp.]|nr:hypothetical protein [Methanocella sp.]
MRDLDSATWQEFEEHIRDILSCYDFDVQFRKVFKSGGRGYQIDVVGLRRDLCLCIDGKKYGRGRRRESSLKAEAAKHYNRCLAHEDAFGIKSIPIIVSWLDDNMVVENGCIFVPVYMLNDFLLNLDAILEELAF